jgi:hypothetical protein
VRTIAYSAVLILVGLVVAVPSAGVTVDRSSGAEARDRVMRLTLRSLDSKEVGSFLAVGTKKVTLRSGYHGGYASYNLFFDERRDTATIQQAMALGSGIITVRIVDDYDTSGIAGRIVQGTGSFRGIEGTVTGRNSNHLKLVYELAQ